MDSLALVELTRPSPSSASDATESSIARVRRQPMCAKLYRAACEGQIGDVMDRIPQEHGGRAAAAAAADGDDQQAIGIDEHEQCDIHEFSPDGNNLLHLAADQGKDELIEELYATFSGEYRNLLSSPNSAQDTPLHCAARAGPGRHNTVRLLVNHARKYGESIICQRNKDGDTALHLVARYGHRDAVNAVVRAAPEMAYEPNNSGMSPLYLAAMSGSVPAVEEITTTWSHASARGPGSQNALHAAVFQDSEMVKLLMRWRPSLANEVDDNNSSPLHFASSDGHPLVVSALLSLAPPSTVYKQDSEGLSALHVAARMGHTKVVKVLMKEQPDAAELRDHLGRTFLHSAAMGGHQKVVWDAIYSFKLGRLLLNAQDKDGNTPLHLAVEAGAYTFVDYLMTSGKVRPDVINNEGFTPYDLALKSTSVLERTNFVATLTAFGAQVQPQRQDHFEPWSGHDIGQKIEKMSEGLAVIAVLITTVAFGAAFNVPGSYKDNGMAVLDGDFTFKCFLVLDGVALISSVLAVILLVYWKVSPRSAGSWKIPMAALSCIWLSLVSIMLAFYAALGAVTCTGAVNDITFYVMLVLFSALTLLVNLWIMPAASLQTMWKILRKTNVFERRSSRRSPLVRAILYNLITFTLLTYSAVIGLAYLSGRSSRRCSSVPFPIDAPAPTPV